MIIAKFTIHLNPVTKKNSAQIIRVSGRPMIIPSKQYRLYEAAARAYLEWDLEPIDFPVNVECVYYMKTRRRVDLVNLEEATLDVLVKHRILADDNSKIVATMDGSRVGHDKHDPRVEITITSKEDENVPD